MSSIQRSAVWNVFTESNESKGSAICNICSQELSFKTSTTILLEHVQKKHPEINIILNSSTSIQNQNGIELPELLPKDIEIIVDDEYDSDPHREEIESYAEDNCDSTLNNSYRNELNLWTHFTKLLSSTNPTVVCNICDEQISYNTTLNAIKHLEKEHPEQLLKSDDSKENSDLYSSVKCSFCLHSVTSEADLQNHLQKYHSEQLGNNIRRKKHYLWKYFTKNLYSNETAECKFCQSEVSYKSDISILENHLIDNHQFNHHDSESTSESEEKFSVNKNELIDFTEELNSDKKNSTSRMWEFFTKIPGFNSEACCNICQNQLSYKSTTFNLKRHLERKHPELLTSINQDIEQILLIKEEFDDIKMDDSDPDKRNFDNDMNNKRSQIWNVFTIKSAEESIATCNVCNQQFSYKSTTNDLKKHFQRKHPNISIESRIEKVLIKTDPNKSDTGLDSSNSDYESEDQEYFSKKPRKHSILWKYFTKSKHEEYIASCNICKKKLGYKTTTTNLRKHLNNKHPHIEINLRSLPDQNQVVKLEIKSSTTDNNLYGSKKVKYYSAIWNYFTRNNPYDYMATCNICGRELCYRTSITNLKKHISNMHIDIKLHMGEELSQNQVSKKSTDQYSNQNKENNCVDGHLYTCEDTKSNQPTIKRERRHYSKLWNHFTRKKSKACVASCNICDKEIGYRTSTSNLKKHLINIHPGIDFQLETEIPQNQINLGSVKTCLICLQNNRELPRIFFQISNNDNEEKSYVTKIGEILNEDIVIDESHVICQSCIDDIEKVYSFKQKISRAFDFWTKLESETETEHYDQDNKAENHHDSIEMKNNLCKFTCEKCHQDFESAVLMLNHTCTHKDQDEVLSTQNGYNCKFCGTCFQKQWKRDKHMRLCRNPVKKYDCTICGKTYKSAFLLREHTTVHTGERNYMCHLCGKTFHRASVRHKHLQAHNRKPGEKIKQKPFLCFICGKTFPTNVASRHMRVHSGIKRKECHICYKRFDQLAHLKIHLRTHSGERPYECEICERRFSLPSTLRIHMRRHDRSDY
ncbi:zinc finger protein 658B-like [Diorhabda carinulata]|uniref:zinc finger protein 658B-like n=1 Tax=Diorhabda carinulata TaxID=1163345 RepID=UPI0025A0AE21|nr:zinc finger protein 658B-like [Diorhabda carinulata]